MTITAATATTTTAATEEAAVTSTQSFGSADGLSPEAVRADAAALFRSHQAVVEGVCRRMLRDADESQDAVQEAFVGAFRALLAGTRPRDAEAWLATIARNECLRRIRARMREPLALTAEPADRVDDVHELAASRAAAALLWQEIARLPERQRGAVVLRELGGRSYDQVASELGVTTTAVESLLFRAREQLRRRLRSALTALNLAPFATQIGRLFGGEVAPRLTSPLMAKSAAFTAGLAVLGGGAVATERHIDRPHRAPASAPVAVATDPVLPVHVQRAAAPRPSPAATPATFRPRRQEQRVVAPPRRRIAPPPAAVAASAPAVPEPVPVAVTPVPSKAAAVAKTLARPAPPNVGEHGPAAVEAGNPTRATPTPSSATSASAPPVTANEHGPGRAAGNDNAGTSGSGHGSSGSGGSGSGSSGHGSSSSSSGEGGSPNSGHGSEGSGRGPTTPNTGESGADDLQTEDHGGESPDDGGGSGGPGSDGPGSDGPGSGDSGSSDTGSGDSGSGESGPSGGGDSGHDSGESGDGGHSGPDGS